MPSVRTQSEDYRMRRTSSQLLRDRESRDYQILENPPDDVSEISDMENRSPKPLCGGRVDYFQLGFIVMVTVGLILLVLYLLSPVFARPIGTGGTVQFTNLRLFDTGEEVMVSSDAQVTNEVRTGATVHDAIFRFRSGDKDLGDFAVAQFSFPSHETVNVELNGVGLSAGNSPDFFKSVLTEETVDLQLEANVGLSIGSLILPYSIPFSVQEAHPAINNFNGGIRTAVAFNSDAEGQLMITLQADFENPSDIEVSLGQVELALSARDAALTTFTLPQLVLAPAVGENESSLSSYSVSGPVDDSSDGLRNLLSLAFSGQAAGGNFVASVMDTTPSSRFLQGVPFDFGDLFLKREQVGDVNNDVRVQDVGPMFTGAAFKVTPLDLVGGVPEQISFGLQIFNPFDSPVTIEGVSLDISIGDAPDDSGGELRNSEKLGTFTVTGSFPMTASSVEAGQTFVKGSIQVTDAGNDRLDRLLKDQESFGMAIDGTMTVSISDVSTETNVQVTMPTFSCADGDSVAKAGELGGEFLGLTGVDAFCIAQEPGVSIEGTCDFINLELDDIYADVCQEQHEKCMLTPACAHIIKDTSAQCDLPNEALPGPNLCWLEKNGMSTGTPAYFRYAMLVQCLQDACQDSELAVITPPTTQPPTAAPTPTPTEEPCPLSEDDVRSTCADEFTACEADNPCRTVVSREEVCEIPEQLLDGGASCFLRSGLNLGSSSFPLLQDVANCIIRACEAAE